MKFVLLVYIIRAILAGGIALGVVTPPEIALAKTKNQKKKVKKKSKKKSVKSRKRKSKKAKKRHNRKRSHQKRAYKKDGPFAFPLAKSGKKSDENRFLDPRSYNDVVVWSKRRLRKKFGRNGFTSRTVIANSLVRSTHFKNVLGKGGWKSANISWYNDEVAVYLILD
jgi:hypothetical protein